MEETLRIEFTVCRQALMTRYPCLADREKHSLFRSYRTLLMVSLFLTLDYLATRKLPIEVSRTSLDTFQVLYKEHALFFPLVPPHQMKT